MSEKKPRGNRILFGVVVLVLVVLGFLIYSMSITELPSGEVGQEGRVIGGVEGGGEIVAETPKTPETGSGVQFTGYLIHEERIDREGNTYIFNQSLEERRRLVIEGSFEQPVTFVLMAETYYRQWLRDNKGKTNKAYVKDPVEKFYTRLDINENEGGVYYFIIQSQENGINGGIKVFELAKL